jgi:hypothetical protein
MTGDIATNAHNTNAGSKIEDVESWLAIRKEAALKIDSETAEIMWIYARAIKNEKSKRKDREGASPQNLNPDNPPRFRPQCATDARPLTAGLLVATNSLIGRSAACGATSR